MGPADSHKDEKLVARVCAGHLQCFETLVDRHLNSIRLFTAYYCPSPDLVDSITSETFVFALKNIHQFNREAHFRGWLQAVAFNLVSARIRQVLSAETGDRFTQKRLAEYGRKPCAPYGISEAEILENSVRQLPAQHQELLKQHYREGRSAAKLASRLGRAPSTLRLALLRLRQEIIACVKRHQS